MNAASSRGESDPGTFEDLLTRHRADFRSRVDLLRCSIQTFDEKCRIHFGSARSGLPRRRSDGDLAWCGQSWSTVVDSGTLNWETSGSDTDESVIEVCPVSQKVRQSRTTQTSTSTYTYKKGTRTPNCADPSQCRSVRVRDVSTQTTDDITKASSDFLTTLKEENVSDQLLEVFKDLGSERSKNGLHRPRGRNQIFNSPFQNSSKILDIISKLQILRNILDSSRTNGPESKRRHLFKKKSKTRLSAVLPNIGQNLSEIENADNEFETTCDCLDCGSDVNLTSRYDCHALGLATLHAEDDLWRLAEEGRLPWMCDISSREPNGQTLDNSPIKLFYCNEVVSAFGPVRLFKRHRRERMYPPIWELISIPAMLGVIPEY